MRAVLFLAVTLLLAPATKATPGKSETVTTKGYYTFAVPKSWPRTDDPKQMTKHEFGWELPREGDAPSVALVHRRLSKEEDIAAAVSDWKKRWSEATVTERKQAIPGAPGLEAKVYLIEAAKDRRAIVGAVVDLSAVDARTDGAYTRVFGGVFELEGPASQVLGYKTDFDALVRSVGLRDL